MKPLLRIIVVEDNSDTRSLIKNQLVSNQLGTVTCYANGAPLIQQSDPIEADIMIIGMELENSYAGTDLIRHLARLKKIPPWTKVIFATNQSDKVESDLPLLGQKCHVLKKPLNFKQFSDIVRSSIELCKIGRETFSKIDNLQDLELIKLVKSLPAKVTSKENLDSIRLLQSKLLLKLNSPNLVFSVLASIKDPALKHLAQMHYYLYFGQLNNLQQTLESAKHSGLLLTKRNHFHILEKVIQRDYGEAYDIIKQKKDAELLPPEITLKATLITLESGAEKATEYLQTKRRVSLENHYFRSSLTVTQMFICLMQMVTSKYKGVSDEWCLEQIRTLEKEASLNRAGNDFKSFIPFIMLGYRVLNDEFKGRHDELTEQLEALIHQTTNLEPTKRFILIVIYAHSGNHEAAYEELLNLAKLFSEIEISPEFIINFLLYDLFIETTFSDEIRAKLLNRLGKTLYESRFPAVSLRLFYRSYRSKPDFYSNTLNLVSTLVRFQIPEYLDISVEYLLNELEGKDLDPKQQQFFRKLKSTSLA